MISLNINLYNPGIRRTHMDPQEDERQENATPTLTLGIGLVLGFPMGLALGFALGSLAIGITIGIAIGLGLGNAFAKPKRPLTEREKKRRLLVQIFGILFFVAGVLLILLRFWR